MAQQESESSPISAVDYDAVIVGASLAGCTTAMLLARDGARVALVEKQPDPAAFKRMCSHFIQASAVPTIERLGLLEPILAAGGLRSAPRIWTQWGIIAAPKDRASQAVNIRREVLDPMIREMAAQTPGVDLMLGRTATGLVRRGEGFAGAVVRDREGVETELRAPLTIGADGRDSRVAKLSGVKEKILPHRRFAYGGYFEGAAPDSAPDGTIWMTDPQFGAAFPTDGGLVFYAAMPTKDRLPEFKRDPEKALVDFIGDLPDGPPIREGRLVGEVTGKIEMPNRVRALTAPGLALVGDAALAADPLFGIGCGWAFQSGEWLADAVAPALAGREPLSAGLKRYRRTHSRKLKGHAFFVNDYSTGRRLNPAERLSFSAAARDADLATLFDRYGSRSIGPARMLAEVLPRAVWVNTRYAVRARRSRVGAARTAPRAGTPVG